jgi:hypothetical protein
MDLAGGNMTMSGKTLEEIEKSVYRQCSSCSTQFEYGSEYFKICKVVCYQSQGYADTYEKDHKLLCNKCMGAQNVQN